MPYVRVRKFDLETMRQQIDAGLKADNLTVDDLLRKLAYFDLTTGRQVFAKLYENGQNIELLRRITTRLGLDHEAVSGERFVEDYQEYLSVTFEPVLVRIPERTRPNQIFVVSFAGLNHFLRVKTFPELLNVPLEQALPVVSKQVREDKERDKGLFFGGTIAYAYIYELSKALPLSLSGVPLTDLDTSYVQIGTRLKVKCSVLASSDGVIVRLKSRETEKIITTPQE